VKFRSGNITQADLYHAAFPKAACVFVYRDGVGWVRSLHYFTRNLGMPAVLDAELWRFTWWIITAGADVGRLEPPIDPERDAVHPEEVQAPAWAFAMEEYLRQYRIGVPLLAVRYNEINADPPSAVARLLAALRLAGRRGSRRLARVRAGLPGGVVDRARQAAGDLHSGEPGPLPRDACPASADPIARPVAARRGCARDGAVAPRWREG
jgi:hypothetical protein